VDRTQRIGENVTHVQVVNVVAIGTSSETICRRNTRKMTDSILNSILNNEELLLQEEVAYEQNTEGLFLGHDPDGRLDPTLDPPDFFHPLTQPRPLRERLRYAEALEWPF